MISIIIPVYNEADQIVKTIVRTRQASTEHLSEIIVVDGGSEDDTVAAAKAEGVKVIKCPKGRARQMNCGAKAAKGDILYFLHADTIPPQNFTTHIINACQNRALSGCFRLAFDYDHWFLKVHSWFTRFDVNAIRFGDQSLFVVSDVFKESGGFREDLFIMEDQEIIHRLKKYGKFKVINEPVITSARKYTDNGVYRMQGIFYRIWALYYLGYSQEYLLGLYKSLIRKQKL